jgi:hypothetical protein
MSEFNRNVPEKRPKHNLKTKLLAGSAALGSAMAIGAGIEARMNPSLEPIDWSTAEVVETTEEGQNIIEDQEGNRYVGVYVSGPDKTGLPDLGLDSDQLAEVQELNGIETLDGSPRTIFIPEEYRSDNN